MKYTESQFLSFFLTEPKGNKKGVLNKSKNVINKMTK